MSHALIQAAWWIEVDDEAEAAMLSRAIAEQYDELFALEAEYRGVPVERAAESVIFLGATVLGVVP